MVNIQHSAQNTPLDALSMLKSIPPELVLQKEYFFHDIGVTCQTNHPALLSMLDTLFAAFPVYGRSQGVATYCVACYDHAAQFPVQLPHRRTRTEATRLLTNTRVKYYRDDDSTTRYLRYVAQPGINEAILSVIDPKQQLVLTQLEAPERYEATFLRRYVLLLALGQLMQPYGFEPCHAAAVTAPWDDQQGALIVGASGSGKTTLSLGCASIGCGLLGDDLVLLRRDDAGGTRETIGAYSITSEVSVRSGTIEVLPTLSFLKALPADARDKRYCTIEQLRAGATRTQTPIRALIFPALTSDEHSMLIPLSKATTLQELIEQCIRKEDTHQRDQEKLFFLLSDLVEQAPGYRLAVARGRNDGAHLVCSLFKR